MSKTAPYRIEERVTQPDGSPTVTYADEFDDRGEALSHYAWLAHRSRFGAPYSVNADPDEDDFRPHSRRRLVLLGPDRTVLPAHACFSSRLEEVALSSCRYGCKVMACRGCGRDQVVHSSIYGCPAGRPITEGPSVDDLGERPAQPGELCTCGRPALKVFTGGQWGDTGYCGLPDGGQKGPCRFCGGPRHTGQRCPQYTLTGGAL